MGEMRKEIGPDAGEVGAGFVNIPLDYGDSNIPFLDDAAAAGSLVDEHVIVLVTNSVKSVLLVSQKQRFFKVGPVQASVDDGDLRRRAAVQRIEDFGICQKHCFLVLFRGDGVVDVGKAKAFGVLAPDEKNPIRPDAPDGNHALYAARNGKAFSVLFQHSVKRFNHGVSGPPFYAFR
ncbi:hypothetical protein SDC9_105583 [bioreactor metagenome]|uniref:Uncharacterized protein n=1 Tax=bioreactor metagenome TaxID=1076179 RepID=A0A645AZY3_9ZZZZ